MTTIIPHSFPDIGQEEIDSVAACLRSNQIKGGARLRTLEQTIATDQGYLGGVATTSGSQAIHLALRALYSGKPARVGLPSYVCRSVYDAVVMAGCSPVLLDIDRTTFSVSSREVVHRRLEAVIVPHMFGIRAPIEEFLDAGMDVIEDCAQRISVEPYEADAKGSIRILSFEATKLITCGEGGIFLCDDERLLSLARQLRDGPYTLTKPALWLPLTDLQASMALVQWRRLPQFLSKRKEIASFYWKQLEKEFSHNLVEAMNTESTFPFRFILQVNDPQHCMEIAEDLGVMFRRPVAPFPLHRLFPARRSFPVSDEVFAHLVSIPIYPHLTTSGMKRVVQAAITSLS